MLWLVEVERDSDGNITHLGDPLPETQVIQMLERMEYHLNERSLENTTRADLYFDAAVSLFNEVSIRRSLRTVPEPIPKTSLE